MCEQDVGFAVRCFVCALRLAPEHDGALLALGEAELLLEEEEESGFAPEEEREAAEAAEAEGRAPSSGLAALLSTPQASPSPSPSRAAPRDGGAAGGHSTPHSGARDGAGACGSPAVDNLLASLMGGYDAALDNARSALGAYDLLAQPMLEAFRQAGIVGMTPCAASPGAASPAVTPRALRAAARPACARTLGMTGTPCPEEEMEGAEEEMQQAAAGCAGAGAPPAASPLASPRAALAGVEWWPRSGVKRRQRIDTKDYLQARMCATPLSPHRPAIARAPHLASPAPAPRRRAAVTRATWVRGAAGDSTH